MNKFLEYLWNKDLATRFEVFGTLAASIILMLLDYQILSLIMLINTFGFYALNSLLIFETYIKKIMEANDLETDIYENTDEFWDEVIGE